MSAVPSVNAKARDITIEFTDSCNWCCWCCRSDDTPIYINSQGKAEVFDPKKASDERQSLQRSLSNLQKKVDEIAKAARQERRNIATELQNHIQDHLIIQGRRPLTLGVLDDINGIIANILR